MARVKLSPLVISLKGSIGSVTFTGQGNSAVAKSKAYNSLYDAKGQMNFLLIRKLAYDSWFALSSADRRFVEQFVTIYKRYQLASGSVAKSAQFHYLKWFSYLYAAGHTPTLVRTVDPMTKLSFWADYRYVSGQLCIDIDLGVPNNYVPILFAGRPRPKELAYESNNVSIVIAASSPSSGVYDIHASYAARHGVMPSIGQSAWLGVYAVGTSNLHITSYFPKFSTIS